MGFTKNGSYRLTRTFYIKSESHTHLLQSSFLLLPDSDIVSTLKIEQKMGSKNSRENPDSAEKEFLDFIRKSYPDTSEHLETDFEFIKKLKFLDEMGGEELKSLTKYFEDDSKLRIIDQDLKSRISQLLVADFERVDIGGELKPLLHKAFWRTNHSQPSSIIEWIPQIPENSKVPNFVTIHCHKFYFKWFLNDVFTAP